MKALKVRGLIFLIAAAVLAGVGCSDDETTTVTLSGGAGTVTISGTLTHPRYTSGEVFIVQALSGAVTTGSGTILETTTVDPGGTSGSYSVSVPSDSGQVTMRAISAPTVSTDVTTVTNFPFGTTTTTVGTTAITNANVTLDDFLVGAAILAFTPFSGTLTSGSAPNGPLVFPITVVGLQFTDPVGGNTAEI